MPTARPMPIFNQGDVVKVPFPYTDQPVRQRRPALVVSAGTIGRDGTLLWVAMITSADNPAWPDDVTLSGSQLSAGLTAASVVRPCKLATIEAAHCERLGEIDDGSTQQVLSVIHRLLK
jgi:mRNA interferase MazF